MAGLQEQWGPGVSRASKQRVDEGSPSLVYAFFLVFLDI